MPTKKRTKAELIEAILDYEEVAFRNIVHGFPDELRTHIKRLMRIKTLTKGALEHHHMFQESPSQRGYRFPLTQGTPENVVLSNDDPLLPIIKVADEAYGDGLVMDYYKVPTGEFGDTLASFIVREIGDAVDTSDGVAYSADFEAAAHLLTAAAGQLDDVAEALAREAGKMRNPDNLWQKVVLASDCTSNEDGTLTCPTCGGTYDECPCPGPSQEELYEYSVDDGVMYARRKVEDTRPLGKVMETKVNESVLREMSSDEDRKAESNLILAANMVYPSAQALQRCPTCKNEIDLDMCYCGTSRADHNDTEQGHCFVPAGCDCGRGK